MPKIIVAKQVDEEPEIPLVESPKFSQAEKNTINDVITRTFTPKTSVDDHLPFILRRIIVGGVIPVYNDKFTYDTRIVMDTRTIGINLDSYEIHQLTSIKAAHNDAVIVTEGEGIVPAQELSSVKQKSVKHKKGINKSFRFEKDILKIIPSDKPINVVGLFVPPTLLKFLINKRFINICDTLDQKSYQLPNDYQRGVKPPEYPFIFKQRSPEEIPFYGDKSTDAEDIRFALSVLTIGESVFSVHYAPVIEETIRVAMNYMTSSVALYSRALKLNTYVRLELNFDSLFDALPDTVPIKYITSNYSYKGLPSITLSTDILDFFKECGIVVSDYEYAGTPISILILTNNFENYIHKMLGQEYRRSKFAEAKFIDRGLLKEYINVSKYERAYKNLYGTSELMKLKPKNNSLASLVQLIPEERLIKVKEEIRRQDALWKSIKLNTCPHIEVMKRFENSILADDIKSSFLELISFANITKDMRITNLIERIKNPKYNVKDEQTSYTFESFIICRVCGYNLLCPHRFVQVDYVVNSRPFDFVKEKFKMFEDRDNKRTNSIVCKICDEELYRQFMDLTGDHIPITSSDDRRALWHDATFMINTFVKFAEGVYDKTYLIRSMVNRCYSIIMGLMSSLGPGMNPDTYRKIYSDIVFAAYLINLEKKTKKNIRFDYDGYILSIPISKKRNTERMIAQFQTQLSDIEVNLQVIEIDPILIMEKDAMYSLAANLFDTTVRELITSYMKRHGIDKLNQKKGKAVDKYDAYAALPYIQVNESDIDKYMSQVKHKFGDKYGGKKDNVVSDSATKHVDVKDIYGNDVKFIELSTDSPLAKLRMLQLMLIYNKNVQYGKGKSWTIPGDTIGPNSPQKTDKNILNTIAAVNKLNSIYTLLVNRRAAIPLLDRARSAVPKRTSWFSFAELYDKNGDKIVWDMYIYGDVKVKAADATFAKQGKSFDDKYSTKNDLLFSKARFVDDTRIRNIMESKHSEESLISYYFNRCPEGGMHVRNKDNVCTKCGIYNEMTADDKHKYALKYIKRYEETQSDITPLSSPTKKVAMSKKDTVNVSEDIINMQLSEDIVKNISSIFGLPYNICRYIAMLEGIIYDDIVNNETLPKYPPTTKHTYVTGLNAYVSCYFSYKAKKGLVTGKFKMYTKEYNKRCMIPDYRTKSSDERARYVESLMDWMRAILYTDILEYYHTNTTDALEIMNKIFKSDSLLCKNIQLYNEVVEDAPVDVDVDDDVIVAKLEEPEEGENGEPAEGADVGGD